MKKIPIADYARLLRDYLRPQVAWVLLLAFLLFGGIALQLINPQIMRRFIDLAEWQYGTAAAGDKGFL